MLDNLSTTILRHTIGLSYSMKYKPTSVSSGFISSQHTGDS